MNRVQLEGLVSKTRKGFTISVSNEWKAVLKEQAYKLKVELMMPEKWKEYFEANKNNKGWIIAVVDGELRNFPGGVAIKVNNIEAERCQNYMR